MIIIREHDSNKAHTLLKCTSLRKVFVFSAYAEEDDHIVFYSEYQL